MAVQTGEKPTAITDLKPKMALSGVVKKVELFGAFVDVGVGKDGLLHISQLSSGHVRNVSDVVKEGDEVNVWVMGVDPEKGRINLTLLRPPERDWNDIQVGNVVAGTVSRVEKFGAFVDIGAERAGRIHVSELSTEFVKNPEDVVKVGDEIQVKVISVNSQKRQIDLSIKALTEPTVVTMEEVEVDEDEASVPTAMELALRQAMKGTDLEDEMPRSKRNKRSKKRRSKRDREEQEWIMKRTRQ